MEKPAGAGSPPAPGDLIGLLGCGSEAEELRHIRVLPARAGDHVEWPSWLHQDIVTQLAESGVAAPWSHQTAAAELLHEGQHTIIATGTASGKSLAYQLPALDAVHRDGLAQAEQPGAFLDGATVLYLSPTKALAADQLSTLRGFDLATLRVASYDGDTDPSERRWIREHANIVLCNPDMLHIGILPNHAWWASFLRRLRYVVIDEVHSYRGVFGSHVSAVLRRLRRICQSYGSQPVFCGASATVALPAEGFSRLVGAPAVAVTEDASPRGETTVAFWEPQLSEFRGENGAPERRSSIAETSALLADLVAARVRTLAFIRSRRGAEAIAGNARRLLAEVDNSLTGRVAAYRSGYLPEERRELEKRLRIGSLLGVASTPALELGIDVSGLDAVLVAGWPGTRASLFQQIGRAGRAGQDALAALIASDDPLDTYLVNHPEAVFDTGLEASIFDPQNPFVLGPQLCAAAAELPLTSADLELFGAQALPLLDDLVAGGYLRKRPQGWYWTHSGSAAALVDLRGNGGAPLEIVDADNGVVLGTIGSAQAHHQVHRGAVYTHQGVSYLVEELDEEQHCAVVRKSWPDYYTTARDVTQIEVLEDLRQDSWGPVHLHFGTVQVTTQVTSFQRKSLLSNEVLGEEPLELSPRELETKAFWLRLSSETLKEAGLSPDRFPGALHAAEHAAIGLLGLVASCDRWDIGGVYTPQHADTGEPTIFVYDGHPGGAGFAERGFDAAAAWLRATKDAIVSCDCDTGCPSCVQSPKCGNKNNPLDKAGAVALLSFVLSHQEEARPVPGHGPGPAVAACREEPSSLSP
ncbi:DEAD/DEAH box helicase [Acaricomes phytoseiuli]|uniref:DEAD/DEAH box helicase n=1 Tax=Acaricomes phytoseiuli TaxID=291968 RepID=UPI002221A296|nr:DEAD/DEAH box helicase [Acaricomes phytoseiuli]MCW1249690.1 DEAD/DEAH box helicase [Acaricomes phytoseiuli]